MKIFISKEQATFFFVFSCVLLTFSLVDLNFPDRGSLVIQKGVTITFVIYVTHYFIKYTRIFNGPLNAYSLVIIAFAFAYPFSTFAHLLEPEAGPRGFYDIVRGGGPFALQKFYFAFLIMYLSFAALVIGLQSQNRSRLRRDQIPKVSVQVFATWGLVFTVIGAVSTAKIITIVGGQAFSAGSLYTVDRLSEIGGGSAKYVFMSQWLAWGVMFLLVAYLGSRLKSNKVFVYVAIVSSYFVVFSSNFWRGGRGAGIVGALPLMFVIKKFSAFRITPILVIFLLSAIVYAALLTLIRASDTVADDSMIVDVIDWHAGRFSMIALAVDMVSSQGLFWGSTALSGLAEVINAPYHLVGFPLTVPVPTSAAHAAVEYLTGVPGKGGISPGSIFELYINFGLIGVVIGYYLLGVAVAVLQGILDRTGRVEVYFVALSLVMFIATSLIPGGISGWLYRFTTTGAPIIALFIYLNLISRRSK